MEVRPLASTETIIAGMPLGSLSMPLNTPGVANIPEQLLWMANEILVRNFRLSPWIHSGSEVRHHRLAVCGSKLNVHGVIAECFEYKARLFAVAELAISAASRPHAPT